MSIRTLATIVAGGMVMTLAGGSLSPLYAQEGTVDADAAIVREVTTRNLLELRLAELARKKSTNPGVKSFADRMRTDHLNLHKQLEALLGKNGQPFRTGLGKMEPQVAEVRQLEKLSGSQFDQQYMASMIRHHQDNVSYFQSTANAARSTQVRTLLTSNLPVLQQHLSLALQVGNQVGAGPTVATGAQYPTPPTQSPAPTTQYPAPPTQTQPRIPTRIPQPAGNVPVVNRNSQADPKAFKKDAKFVREALADNTLEIRLARVAETRTTDPRIRQLARRVLDDHTAMQSEWIALASRNGMNLKPGIGRRHMDKVKRMERTSDFDKAYPTMLIQNNQDYVEYFQKEGQATHSAQVRSQAASDLSTLRQHLVEAKRVALVHGVDTTAALKARNLSSYKKK